MHIYDIMHNSSHIIKPERVSALIKILENSSNRAYLQKQGLLESIISDLKEIVSPQFPSKNKIEPLVQ